MRCTTIHYYTVNSTKLHVALLMSHIVKTIQDIFHYGNKYFCSEGAQYL